MATTTKSTPESNPMFDIVANLARCHCEHERYYAEAPLHEAIKLQCIPRALGVVPPGS